MSKAIETKANADDFLQNLPIAEPIVITVSRSATLADQSKLIILSGASVKLTLPETLDKDCSFQVVTLAANNDNAVVGTTALNTIDLITKSTLTAAQQVTFADASRITCNYKQASGKWYVSTNSNGFISGTPDNAVAATGSITYGVPVNGDTVIVGGTTFTKVAAAPAANQFSNISELEALVEAHALLTSTQDGTSVSIVASTKGAAGNAITLALGGGNSGTMAISGATLSGGINGTVASRAYSVVYGDGDYLWVPTAANTITDTNWRKIPIADSNGVLEASIQLENMTGEVIPANTLALIGEWIHNGDGVKPHGYPVQTPRRVLNLTTFNDTWQRILSIPIPAAWVAAGEILLVKGRISHQHNWSGLVFETTIRAATDPAVGPTADSAFSGSIQSAAAAGYFVDHEFRAQTTIDEFAMGYTGINGFDNLRIGNGAVHTQTIVALGPASAYKVLTLGVDSVVDLWVYKETTGAPASCWVEAELTVLNGTE